MINLTFKLIHNSNTTDYGGGGGGDIYISHEVGQVAVLYMTLAIKKTNEYMCQKYTNT